MGDFEDVYKHLKKSTKEDPHSRIFKAGDIKISGNVPYGILSGIPRLDFSLGRPGLPVGRVIEYFGFEMSGKTTAALHALAQAQRCGGGGLYIDAEYSWDEDRAIDIGIDPYTNFILSQVDTIEGIFRVLDETIKNADVFMRYVSYTDVCWPDGYNNIREAPYIIRIERTKLTEVINNPLYNSKKNDIKGTQGRSVTRLPKLRTFKSNVPISRDIDSNEDKTDVILYHIWDMLN